MNIQPVTFTDIRILDEANNAKYEKRIKELEGLAASKDDDIDRIIIKFGLHYLHLCRRITAHLISLVLILIFLHHAA